MEITVRRIPMLNCRMLNRGMLNRGMLNRRMLRGGVLIALEGLAVMLRGCLTVALRLTMRFSGGSRGMISLLEIHRGLRRAS